MSKSRPLKFYLLREYLILIGNGAELHIVQCSILVLRLVQRGVEADTEDARETFKARCQGYRGPTGRLRDGELR